jgi:hypothetical protein
MRCRDDAKAWLDAQRNPDLDREFQAPVLQEIEQTDDANRNTRHHQPWLMEERFDVPTPLMRASISTDRIMHAIQQQRRATQQLEHIRCQQRTRVERLGPFAAAAAALGLFLLSSIPLFCFAVLLIQTDIIASLIMVLSGVLDVCIIVAQYLQEELTLLTHNNLLLSGLAFAIVVMMGMWLRLMRPPREA